MRWAGFVFCALLLAFASASAPLLASDLKSGKIYKNDRLSPEDEAQKIVAYCYDQRTICKKICRLRFREDLIGCPQTCESRVPRCVTSACFKWLEPEFVIAERFGGYRCAF